MNLKITTSDILAGLCIVAGGFIAAMGQDGWGWFLAAGVLILA